MPRNSRFVVVFAAAMLFAVGGIVLLTQLGGDGDDPAVATAPASVPTTAQGTGTGEQDGAATQGDATADARLVAGDVELLPIPQGGLAELDGQQVQGTRLVVVRVVDRGFYVGRRAGDPQSILVEHRSSYVPREGDRVDLEGEVERSGTAEEGLVDARSVVPQGTGGGADGDGDPANAEDDRP